MGTTIIIIITAPTRIRRRRILYGVGYLPLPLPFSMSSASSASRGCRPTYSLYNPSLPAAYRRRLHSGHAGRVASMSNDKFAYGADVQAKWQDFAFRAEYEGISSEYGNPAAVMVSVTWTFWRRNALLIHARGEPPRSRRP